jgi:hypothetical protein
MTSWRTGRSLPAAVTLIVALAACSTASPATTPGDGASSAPPGGAASGPTAAGSTPVDQGTGGGAGVSLVEAAVAVTDACTLMPMDLAASIVPNASEPQSQQFPPYKCTVSNGTSVLEITIAPYDAVDPLVPNEPVAGLGVAAYLQTQFTDDSYLKIILDQNGGAIYVEVAGHDGEDHRDDAVAVAQRVLAGLE